jgi:hypothetical protein
MDMATRVSISVKPLSRESGVTGEKWFASGELKIFRISRN